MTVGDSEDGIAVGAGPGRGGEISAGGGVDLKRIEATVQ